MSVPAFLTAARFFRGAKSHSNPVETCWMGKRESKSLAARPSTGAKRLASWIFPNTGGICFIQTQAALAFSESHRDAARFQIQYDFLRPFRSEQLTDDKGRAQGGVAGERHFLARGEDPHRVRAGFPFRFPPAQDECRLGEIEFESDPLHFCGADRAIRHHHRQLVPGVFLLAENVHDEKTMPVLGAFHVISSASAISFSDVSRLRVVARTFSFFSTMVLDSLLFP